jgi:hypothetical protein
MTERQRQIRADILRDTGYAAKIAEPLTEYTGDLLTDSDWRRGAELIEAAVTASENMEEFAAELSLYR